MTRGKLIPIETKLQREDRRLAVRKEREDKIRRKLMPLIVTVCETHKVSTEDLFDSDNRHPVVCLARDLVRYLGYMKFHVAGHGVNVALHQSVVSRDAVPKVKRRYEKSAEFRREVECIEKLLDAQERG